MKITVYKHEGNYDKKHCYVHARGAALADDHLLITMQKLDVSGCDDFSGLEVVHAYCCGERITKPKRDEAFSRKVLTPGIEFVECDATPMHHKASGKTIVIGHYAFYHSDSHQSARGQRNSGYYAIYDERSGAFQKVQAFDVSLTKEYIHCSPGSVQFFEMPSGELLIPFTLRAPEGPMQVCLFRFTFDGEVLREVGRGNILSYPHARGAYEPSIIYSGGKYILTVRNDEVGLYATSEDGYHFSELRPWCFEDGEVIGNYNTQQHFMRLGDDIFLVYTRRGANNDHVFRHRAPLFFARIDIENMCLIRESEQIAVPERGARLGNFGVTNVSEHLAYITVTEWMQPRGCEKYGSDNALFIVRIEKD